MRRAASDLLSSTRVARYHVFKTLREKNFYGNAFWYFNCVLSVKEVLLDHGLVINGFVKYLYYRFILSLVILIFFIGKELYAKKIKSRLASLVVIVIDGK